MRYRPITHALTIALVVGMVAPTATGLVDVERKSQTPEQTVEILAAPGTEPAYVADQLDRFGDDADLGFRTRTVETPKALLEAIAASDADLLYVVGHGDGSGPEGTPSIRVGSGAAPRAAVEDAIQASEAGRVVLLACDVDLPAEIGDKRVYDLGGNVFDVKVAVILGMIPLDDLYPATRNPALRSAARRTVDRMGGMEEIVPRMIRPKATLRHGWIADHCNGVSNVLSGDCNVLNEAFESLMCDREMSDAMANVCHEYDGSSDYERKIQRVVSYGTRAEPTANETLHREFGDWIYTTSGGFVKVQGRWVPETRSRWNGEIWGLLMRFDVPPGCLTLISLKDFVVPLIGTAQRMNELNPGLTVKGNALGLELCGEIWVGWRDNNRDDRPDSEEPVRDGRVSAMLGSRMGLFVPQYDVVDIFGGFRFTFEPEIRRHDHEHSWSQGPHLVLDLEVKAWFGAYATLANARFPAGTTLYHGTFRRHVDIFDTCNDVQCGPRTSSSSGMPAGLPAVSTDGADHGDVGFTAQKLTRAHRIYLEQNSAERRELEDALGTSLDELPDGAWLNMEASDVCKAVLESGTTCDQAAGSSPATTSTSAEDCVVEAERSIDLADTTVAEGRACLAWEDSPAVRASAESSAGRETPHKITCKLDDDHCPAGNGTETAHQHCLRVFEGEINEDPVVCEYVRVLAGVTDIPQQRLEEAVEAAWLFDEIEETSAGLYLDPCKGVRVTWDYLVQVDRMVEVPECSDSATGWHLDDVDDDEYPFERAEEINLRQEVDREVVEFLSFLGPDRATCDTFTHLTTLDTWPDGYEPPYCEGSSYD